MRTSDHTWAWINTSIEVPADQWAHVSLTYDKDLDTDNLKIFVYTEPGGVASEETYTKTFSGLP